MARGGFPGGMGGMNMNQMMKQAKKMHRHRTVHQKKSAANRGKPPLEHGSQYNGNTGAKQDTAQYICREMDIAVQAGSGNQESQNICCDTGRAVI